MNSLLDQHEIGSVVGQALMPSDIDFQNVGGQLSNQHRGGMFGDSALASEQIYGRGQNGGAAGQIPG